MSSIYYIAHGSICGTCAHNHRTIATAYRCAVKHHRDVRSLGGGSYSDRGVYAVEDGDRRPLTVDERVTIDNIRDAAFL